MKPRQNSRLALALGGVGVMLLSMAVHAETFGATVTVQNTLGVTHLQDMNLGTIFATSTADAEQGVAALELSATGVLTPLGANPNVSIYALDSAQPARAQIVSANIPYYVTLPQAVANLATITNDSAGAAIRADGVQLRNLAAPASARLYLVNFSLGGQSAGADVEQQSDLWVYRITPNGTDTTFGIGATLTTEPIAGGDNRKQYQSGVYSGEFHVTASY